MSIATFRTNNSLISMLGTSSTNSYDTDTTWSVDSGACHHMTYDVSQVHNKIPYVGKGGLLQVMGFIFQFSVLLIVLYTLLISIF